MQYEVELYLRIEALLPNKLEVYPTEKDEVMVLQQSVAEAELYAKDVSILLFLINLTIFLFKDILFFLKNIYRLSFNTKTYIFVINVYF